MSDDQLLAAARGMGAATEFLESGQGDEDTRNLVTGLLDGMADRVQRDRESDES